MNKIMITAKRMLILRLLCEGKTNPEIAKETSFSIHSVKIHVSKIIKFFNVNTRIEVAIKAIKEGYIDINEIKL